jgi:membrane protease YdiL (CAAX protease family)
MRSAVTVLNTPLGAAMNHDDSNPSGAAPVRAHASDGPEGAPPPVIDPAESALASLSELPLSPPPRLQFDASVPEDLRTPWGWTDLFLFVGFGFLGLLVAAGIVAGVAVFGFHVPISDFGAASTSPAKSMIAVLAQGVWSGFVLLYFFMLVRVRTKAPFWQTMGWHELHLGGQTASASALRCLGSGAILALLVTFAGKFLNEKGELPIEELFRSRPTVILLMIFGILVAPLVEETMFRGFLYPIVARRFGVGAGVIVTGILFGAMHAQQLWGGWGQIGLLIVVGVLLTWVRARTGTMAASYFVHLGYNSLLFLGFFIATGGLRHFPGGS